MSDNDPVPALANSPDDGPLCPADALHLNPVNHTFQLRPSLTYLDNLVAIERRQKRSAAADDEDEDEEISDTEMKKEAAKAVQVSIKQQAEGGAAPKGPLGGGNGRADAGLFGPMRAEEAESWKPLTHYHANVSLLLLSCRARPAHVHTPRADKARGRCL